jgi:hypothetical protein
MDSLIKSKIVLYKERIWNSFKNQDREGEGIISTANAWLEFEKNIENVSYLFILV